MAGDREVGIFDQGSETYERLLEIQAIPKSHRISDGGVAPDGNFWFGTTHASAQEASGQYYVLSKDKEVRDLRLPPVSVTNSLIFSPDGSTFYTCDTIEQEIIAHDYDAKTGGLSARRVLASTYDLGGFPDGACVDAEGDLWVCLAEASRVAKFSPKGELLESITLAAPFPTSCALGGDDMKTLFITTARHTMSFMQLDARPLSGSLFATRVNVGGTVPQAFGPPG